MPGALLLLRVFSEPLHRLPSCQKRELCYWHAHVAEIDPVMFSQLSIATLTIWTMTTTMLVLLASREQIILKKVSSIRRSTKAMR